MLGERKCLCIKRYDKPTDTKADSYLERRTRPAGRSLFCSLSLYFETITQNIREREWRKDGIFSGRAHACLHGTVCVCVCNSTRLQSGKTQLTAKLQASSRRCEPDTHGTAVNWHRHAHNCLQFSVKTQTYTNKDVLPAWTTLGKVSSRHSVSQTENGQQVFTKPSLKTWFTAAKAC